MFKVSLNGLYIGFRVSFIYGEENYIRKKTGNKQNKKVKKEVRGSKHQRKCKFFSTILRNKLLHIYLP